MPYIYKITNTINGKSYIGKTLDTIITRWKQHQSEAWKERSLERPLYRAIRKYGVSNFTIEVVEECSGERASERERFWIEECDTFKNGYNATLGGDGSAYLDYDKIVELYLETKNIKQTSEILKVDRGYISQILKRKNIEIIPSSEIQKNSAKKVYMKNEQDELIMTFRSQGEAARYIKNSQNLKSAEKGIASHISHVLNGKRKTAYGYKWTY